MNETADIHERALAVGIGHKGGDREASLDQLHELETLAETAGVEVVEKIFQELDKPNRQGKT
jgi:50S ribosomal subunit-associated GTPase HflX